MDRVYCMKHCEEGVTYTKRNNPDCPMCKLEVEIEEIKATARRWLLWIEGEE